MNKQELERFLVPFVDEIEIVIEVGISSYRHVNHIRYQLCDDGVGRIVLQTENMIDIKK